MKSLLLTKSNLRKSRGISIGITLLMLIVSLLLSATLIILFDFLTDVDRQKERLNAKDTTVLVGRNIEGLDDEFFINTLSSDVEGLSISRGIAVQYAVKYGSGTVTPYVYVTSYDRVKDKQIGKFEIVSEDKNINTNYCYLTYQCYTGGGYNTGDSFALKMPGKDYNYTVKGFVNNYNLGTYNNAVAFILVSEEELKTLETAYPETKAVEVDYDLKDGVDPLKFNNRLYLEIAKKNVKSEYHATTSDITASNRTFISVIFVSSFLVTSLVLFFVVILMISNIISNYIKQNMKAIGALKAIGYQSSTIKLSLLFQFGILTLVGVVLGSTLVYSVMPILGSVLVSQYGMPYSVSFTFPAFIIPVLGISLFISGLVLLFTRKISKIEPIVALKDGIETHNFKKNIIPLSKSKLGLNVSLAFKSLFNNIKQHIITFVVLLFLTFGGVIALVMLENMGLHPNLTLLTFETCSGVVSSDTEVKDELYDYLKNREDITNVKFMVIFSVVDGNDIDLALYLTDDINKLNNKKVCYKGRLPKYDNEIIVSGKYAKDYNYNIGDKITVNYGGNAYDYLITGLCQTTNNGGREALLSTEAFSHLRSVEEFPGYYWFDTTSDIDSVLDDIKVKFGDHITSTMNLNDAISGSMSIFVVISWAMVGIILTMTVVVVLVVLYLLMKNLIHNKRYEFGILKSIGYTSRDLIIQNALSFMPSISLGVILSCIISSAIANPYLTMIMSMFGIMQSSFTIPAGLNVVLAIFEIGISFLFAVILSRKIKYLEPYKLLIEE